MEKSFRRKDRMTYHSFYHRDGTDIGEFETFYRTQMANLLDKWEEGEGWFWWTCTPGCLPDSDAIGPFATEQEAIHDARDT
jgi:hypothetical protein